VTPDELRRARFAAQGLDATHPRPLAEVVRGLLGVQAQDLRNARLALRARTPGLTIAEIDAAVADGTLVASWLMRGTLHLVHRDDYPTLWALTAPATAATNRRRLGEEGVPPSHADRAVTIIERALRGGPLPRVELAEHIAAAGIRTEGQAMPHILLLAARRGLVVLGATSDGQPVVVLNREPPTPLTGDQRAAAVTDLVRRYLRGHGPATTTDIATWSGLGLRDIRAGLRALAGELREGRRPGRSRPAIGRPGCRAAAAVARLRSVPARLARSGLYGAGRVSPACVPRRRDVARRRHRRRHRRWVVDLAPQPPAARPDRSIRIRTFRPDRRGGRRRSLRIRRGTLVSCVGSRLPDAVIQVSARKAEEEADTAVVSATTTTRRAGSWAPQAVNILPTRGTRFRHMARTEKDERLVEYEVALDAARTPVAVLQLLAQGRERRGRPGDAPLEVTFAATPVNDETALPAAVWVALRHGEVDASVTALLSASRTEFVVGEHEELDSGYRLRAIEERRVLPDVGVLQMQIAAMLDIPWDVVAMLCEWGSDDPRTQTEVDALLDSRIGVSDGPPAAPRLQMTADELADLVQLTAEQRALLSTLVRQADVTITCTS
jgi:hypothetical protein